MSEPNGDRVQGERVRFGFGVWIAVVVVVLFLIPLLLKFAGFLPTRR